MHDVPEMKNFLRTGEKKNTLGELGLFGGGVNGALDITVGGGQKSTQGREECSAVQRMAAETGDAELAGDVEQHHVHDGERNGQARHPVCGGQAQTCAQVSLGQQVLCRELLRQLSLEIL